MLLKLIKIDAQDPDSGFRVYDGTLYLGAITASCAEDTADAVITFQMDAEQTVEELSGEHGRNDWVRSFELDYEEQLHEDLIGASLED
jgi:hypothetical protein